MFYALDRGYVAQPPMFGSELAWDIVRTADLMLYLFDKRRFLMGRCRDAKRDSELIDDDVQLEHTSSMLRYYSTMSHDELQDRYEQASGDGERTMLRMAGALKDSPEMAKQCGIDLDKGTESADDDACIKTRRPS